MALTKIGTDGIKDDAVTSGKIPANAVGSSEIANQAVTTGKLANNAVDYGKLADSAVVTSKLANNAVQTNKIQDEAVTLAKLEHGTSSNNGKFLRANNGADPTFETVNTDLVSDGSPQLGAALDTNGYNINFGDSSGNGNALNRLTFGTKVHGDLQIYHDGNNSYITDRGTGELRLYAAETLRIRDTDSGEEMITCNKNGSVELFYNNTKVFETGADRIFARNRFNINANGINSGPTIGIGQWDGSNHRIEGDSNRPLFITSYHSDGVRLGASGAVKATVTSNGLTFNGDTAAANALDDYEKGDWTPQVWRNGGSSEISLGSGNRFGRYIKIGDMLWVSFYWYNPSCSTSTGQYYVIRNLPFNLITGNTGAYQFIPGGYLYFNGSNSGDYSGGGAYRWQANGTFAANTLTLYASPNNTNVSGALEFSGTGVLRVA